MNFKKVMAIEIIFLLSILIFFADILAADANAEIIINEFLPNSVNTVYNKQPSVIVLLKDKHSVNKFIAQNRLNMLSKDGEIKDIEINHIYSSFNGFSANITKEGYKNLMDNPDVERIVRNKIKRLSLDISVPLINAPDVWRVVQNSTNITGKGEAVCVIDTGIDYTHPSLGNCTRDAFLAGNCNKVIGGYDFKNKDNDPIDDQGHGTHIAGIIASTNNTFRGVAPDAKLVSLKVCDNSTGGNCFDSDIISAIEWCTNNASKFNISVISISLGGGLFENYCDDDPEEGIFRFPINKAVDNKISVIVSAGNDGSGFGIGSHSKIESPACIQSATAVAASGFFDKVTVFTNRNEITDLFAPGELIESTVPKGNCKNCDSSGFAIFSGTSQATPHVAGAFALMRQFKKLQSNAVLSPKQIENALKNAGKVLNDSGKSNLTFKRIDVYKAIVLLNKTANDTLHPKINSFNGKVVNNANLSGIQRLNVTATDNGTGIANLTFSIGGQNINAFKIENDNWVTDFDTKKLRDGYYNITAIAEDFASNKEVENIVISEILFDAIGKDDGRVWVELFNPANKSVNLSGWDVKGGTRIVTIPDYIIQPKSTIIIANASDFSRDYGFAPDLDLLQKDFDFTNSNDFVQLRNSSDNIIDEMSWGNNDESAYNWSLFANEGNSITRNPVSGDLNEQYDWQSNTSATPKIPTNPNFITVKIDNTPPKIISFNGDVVNNASISGVKIINVTVNDTLSVISNVTFKIDNTANTLILSASKGYSDETASLWASTLNTSLLGDGGYNVTVFANDSAGNINNTFFISVVIDNTPPFVLNFTPQNLSFKNTNTNLISALVVDNTSGINASSIFLNYTLDGIGPFTSAVTIVPLQNANIKNGLNVSTMLFSANAKHINISIDAEDNANNALDTIRWSFSVDLDKPKVNNIKINDTDNVVKSSSVINLSINVTNGVSGIKNITAGNSTVLNLNFLSGAIWNTVANVSSFGCISEGECGINVNAYDNVGNLNNSEKLLLIIDDTAPKIENVKINNTIVSNSTPIKVDATINDANFDSGVVIIKNNSGISMTKISSSQWTVTITPPLLGCSKNGLCTINVKATDSAGNINESERITISIDSNIPVISNITINDTDNIVNSNQIIKINLSISDSNKIISVTANNTVFAQAGDFWIGTNAVASYCGNQNGQCQIAFSVFDNLTNSNNTQSFSIIVDNTPPTLKNIRINSTDLTNSTKALTKDAVNISINATDLNGVENVKLNGTSLAIINSEIWFAVITVSNLCSQEGKCSLEFSATDKADNKATKSINISIEKLNDPPKVLEFPDIIFVEDSYNDSLLLDNFVQDIDNTTSQIKWNVVSISNPNVTAVITPNRIANFTAVKDFSGSSVVTLSAFDGSNTKFGALNVIVKPVNDAPLAPKLIEPKNNSVLAKTNITLSWNASIDADSSSITYYIFNSNGTTPILNGTTAQTSFEIKGLDAGKKYFWRVVASDGLLNSTMSDIRQYTIVSNVEPNITSFSPAGNPIIAETTGAQTFSITATDADNDALTINWFLNKTEKAAGNSYTATALASGVYNVTAVVNDSKSSVFKSWNLTVTSTPISKKYLGNIFNLDKSQLENITNAVINEPTFGSLDFGNNALNLSGVADVDKIINISEGVAAVDAENAPRLNKSANVTMKGLKFKKAPFINFNPGFGAMGNILCAENVCTDRKYDSAAGKLTFKVPHFSTYFVVQNSTNDAPRIVSSPPGFAVINEKFTYAVGVVDLDNSTFIFTLPIKPEGMTINPQGVISWTPNTKGKFEIEVSVSDGIDSASQKFNLSAGEGAKLRIKDIDVKIDGKTSKNVGNNTRIRREAKPGSDVQFKIGVESGFKKEDNMKIEDIDVEVTIEDIDDDEDIEEVSTSFDLGEGRDKTVKVDFKIPISAEEDIYDAVIRADGEDENGTTHELYWKLELDVDKDKHDIAIDRVLVTPSNIRCKSNGEISVAVINIGEEDEEEVMLEARSEALGINFVEKGIEMDSESSFTKSITFKTDGNLEAGLYTLSIVATLEGGKTASKTIDIKAGECAPEAAKKEPLLTKNETEKKPATKKVGKTTAKETAKEKALLIKPINAYQPTKAASKKEKALPIEIQMQQFRESDGYLKFLIASIAILFALSASFVIILFIKITKI